MHTKEIFIIDPNSPEQASALKAFVEALKMKFVISESRQEKDSFEHSEEQKRILDSQENISKEDCADAFESLKLTKVQQNILDDRLKADKIYFSSARESLDKLRQKYEL